MNYSLKKIFLLSLGLVISVGMIGCQKNDDTAVGSLEPETSSVGSKPSEPISNVSGSTVSSTEESSKVEPKPASPAPTDPPVLSGATEEAIPKPSSSAEGSSAVEKSSSSQVTPAEKSSSSQIAPYVKIACVMDYEGNTQNKTVTDFETVKEIKALFEGLEEVETDITPILGGRVFLVDIYEDGSVVSYRLARERDREGNAFCQYAPVNLLEDIEWLKMKDDTAYGYFKNMFGF